MKKRILAALTAAVCLSLGAAGCSKTPAPPSASESDAGQTSAPAVSAVAFSESVLTLSDDSEPIRLEYTVTPANAQPKVVFWASSDESVVKVSQTGQLAAVSAGRCTVTLRVDAASATLPVIVESSRIYAPPVVTVSQPGLKVIDGVLIANKSFPLPDGYEPGGLLPQVLSAWEVMVSDAKADGIDLFIISGYRSYETQKELYESYVYQNGREEADTYSARPGHSEHQTGLAFDINEISYSFGETPEGRWVKENAAKYGFIIRYPQEKQTITGYIYEPWHLRYLGTDLALKVERSGLCLEEYFNIPSQYAE